MNTRATLGVLWIGWLVLLLASFAAGWTHESWWDGARLDLRMVSCLLLVVAAWAAWWVAARYDGGRQRWRWWRSA